MAVTITTANKKDNKTDSTAKNNNNSASKNYAVSSPVTSSDNTGTTGSNKVTFTGDNAESYLSNIASQYTAPTYTSQYQTNIDSVLNQILNRGSFSYDQNTDSLYQQYKDQYTANGNKAMRDTMGNAAALTGGYGSSYATTAGSQAYDSYMEQLNDKGLELRQQALTEYNQETQDLLNKYSTLADAEDAAYNRYLQTYKEYQDQRDTAIGIGEDTINQYNSNRTYEADRADAAQEQANWEAEQKAEAEQNAYENSIAEEELKIKKAESAADIENTKASTAYTKAQTANVGKSSSTSSTSSSSNAKEATYSNMYATALKYQDNGYSDSAIINSILDDYPNADSTTLAKVLKELGISEASIRKVLGTSNSSTTPASIADSSMIDYYVNQYNSSVARSKAVSDKK